MFFLGERSGRLGVKLCLEGDHLVIGHVSFPEVVHGHVAFCDSCYFDVVSYRVRLFAVDDAVHVFCFSFERSDAVSYVGRDSRSRVYDRVGVRVEELFRVAFLSIVRKSSISQSI